MPLLGKKVFNCLKSLNDIRPEETIFIIPHTKEQFRSRAEFDKRKDLYDERIWTCQCTGHINLTHEEAWNSEKAVQKTLKNQFSDCFEKPVLEIVHHSTLSLDTLVDQAWLKLQQVLSLKERVCLRIKNAAASGKGFSGSIVMIDTSGVQANPTSNCSSPSSDKENSSGEGRESSPKKWVPPKLLPYKYSIKLEEEDKIINGIPASDLVRVDRPPSKELLRLFIRASAIRVGVTSTSPWVVNDILVKKYSLPSKFADFLLSPAKMAEAAKRAEEESVKKRKHNSQHKGGPVKKLKTTKSLSKLSDKKGSLSAKKKIKKKDKEKSPKKRKSSEIVIIESEDSSDDEVLAKLKLSNDSDSDTPLVSLKNQLTPKKKKMVSNDSDSDTPLSKLSSLSPKRKKLKLDSSPKKSRTPKKDSPKKSPTKSASKSGKNTDGTPKKRGRPRKDESSTPNSKKGKKTPTKKGMKQMTLLDIAGKKGSNQSPSKSVRKSPAVPPTPMIVRRMLKLNRDTHKDRIKYSLMLKQAAITLTPHQKSNLPASVKDEILKRCEKLEEKKLLDKMSPEERETYLKDKKKQLTVERMEKFKAKQQEMKKRYEDQNLKLTPLPPPKLVPTPDGLPNECFGDVAMVTEFVSCYEGLLMPDEEYPIYSDALMKSLTTGSKGFAYTSRVLVVLLQTLLQDEIAEAYKELRVSLADIPVNAFTASELVRLCLRKDDASSSKDIVDEFAEEDYDEVSDRVVQQLETQEFHQLDASDKLKILQGLCLRIMGSYSVQDYMDNKQKEANKLVRGQKQTKDKTKDEKIKKEDIKMEKVEEMTPDTDEKPAQSAQNPILSHFYGKTKEAETDSGSAAGESMDDTETNADGGDLITVLKSRRLKVARMAAEKEKKEKERREQKEKEYKEYKKQLEKERQERACKDGVTVARKVLRHIPIGTDRNHNRYWVFNHTTPGLYIEKGWVNTDIDYNCQEGEEKNNSLPCTPKKSDSVTSGSQPNTPAKRKKTAVETTLPHPGQNLWFTYDNIKEVDAMMKALHPQGIRENALKTAMKKQYENIAKAIDVALRTSSELRDSDGDEELLTGVRRELLDAELRLRNGGLGGIPLFDAWETKVMSATGVKELAACLKEIQMNVSLKFFKGFMKPKNPKPQVKEIAEEDIKEEDEEEDEDAVASCKAVADWFEALESCPTFSRLHVLLGMLDSCIKWEKSAENAKCKICRKKGNDEAVLLCDECNQAFHMYCLRPALAYIPRGDWYCPACIPQSKRRRCREVKRYNDNEDYDDYDSNDDEDEEDIEHMDECAECGGDEGLVECTTCPSAYHIECHNPPLRHPPRGRWECSDCKSGTNRTRSRNKARQARSKRRAAVKRKESSSEEEPSEEEAEDEEEEDNKEEDNRRDVRRKAKQVTVKKESTSNLRSRSSSRRREQANDSYDQKPVYSRRPPSELSIIQEILEKVMKHKAAWPFLEAVDKKEVPDYHLIVKHPMDFHTMKNKLARLSYSSPEEVIKDTALVFRNAAIYNKEESEVYTCMQEVEKVFVDILSKKLPFYHYSRDPVSNGYDDHGFSNRRRSRR